MLSFSRSRRLLASLVATSAVSLAACQSITNPGGNGNVNDPPVPTTLEVAPSSLNFTSFGDQQQLTGTVRDQNGNALSGQTISWSSDDTSVVKVDAAGLVTAFGNGMATVEATSGSLSPVQVGATVAQGEGLVIESGNGQTGLVGYRLNDPVQVKVYDAMGDSVVGATVLFVVASGGGSAPGGVAVSDGMGVATFSDWILGSTAGTNTLDAVIAGVDTVTFTATGSDPLYDIEVRFVSTPTTSQREAFDSAEAKWERLIYGNLPAQPVNVSANFCGTTHPAVNETVDDLVIYAELTAIDGAGGILGRAGPCASRGSTQHTALGTMEFDVADLAALEAAGNLDAVILHEMGHVIGVGTHWDGNGFLELPSDTAPASIVDTYFDGPEALEAFDALGGGAYGGNKVPVENDNTTYGSGSLNSHWRESVVGTELMSPALNGGVANPLSLLTAASLTDLSYLVNHAGSDSYSLPVAPVPLRAGASYGSAVSLVDDVINGPIYVLDSSGRIERVILPRGGRTPNRGRPN